MNGRFDANAVADLSADDAAVVTALVAEMRAAGASEADLVDASRVLAWAKAQPEPTITAGAVDRVLARVREAEGQPVGRETATIRPAEARVFTTTWRVLWRVAAALALVAGLAMIVVPSLVNQPTNNDNAVAQPVNNTTAPLTAVAGRVVALGPDSRAFAAPREGDVIDLAIDLELREETTITTQPGDSVAIALRKPTSAAVESSISSRHDGALDAGDVLILHHSTSLTLRKNGDIDLHEGEIYIAVARSTPITVTTPEGKATIIDGAGTLTYLPERRSPTNAVLSADQPVTIHYRYVPLETVLADARALGVTVKTDEPELLECPISFAVDGGTRDEFVEALQRALDSSLALDAVAGNGNTYQLTRNGAFNPDRTLLQLHMVDGKADFIRSRGDTLTVNAARADTAAVVMSERSRAPYQPATPESPDWPDAVAQRFRERLQRFETPGVMSMRFDFVSASPSELRGVQLVAIAGGTGMFRPGSGEALELRPNDAYQGWTLVSVQSDGCWFERPGAGSGGVPARYFARLGN